MKLLGLAQFSFAAFGVVIALEGCGGAPATAQFTSVPTDRAGSWMLPGAAKGSLLYVSDTATNNVYVFSYPQGKLVGALAGFNGPQGLCSDRSGNVFVANSNGEETLEYVHGGKAPIETLYDPPHTPDGCSVDPTTGNLAVTEGSSGDVAIYRRATGKPKHYVSSDINQFTFCGYDDRGNLFVDGSSYYYYYFELDELARGSKGLESVGLNQSIMQPGGVQWDGSYVAIGDASAEKIYRFSVSHGKGMLEGTTSLTGALTVNQFWIAGSELVAANVGGPNVMVWAYPAGGAPREIIGNPRAQLHKPIGVTVSSIH